MSRGREKYRKDSRSFFDFARTGWNAYKRKRNIKKKLQISNLSDAAPSGSKVVFLKPESKKRHRKSGQKKGHTGRSRKVPTAEEITKEVTHSLEICPDCNSAVYPPNSMRKRIIIDIEMKTEVAKHNISSHWCPKCKVVKEKTITDALPGFTIGNKALVYSALLHFRQGVSLSNIVKNMGFMNLKITTGCLVNAWHTLAEILKPFYEEIKSEIKSADAVHGDETGWRQFGKRFWLWGFFTVKSALYVIRSKRNRSVVIEILGNTFNGILITDFWKPYLAVAARLRQWCVAHYLREFIKIENNRKDHSKSYLKFRRIVRRLFTDALIFSKKKEIPKEERIKRQAKFLKRLDRVSCLKTKDEDVIRLQKRLKTYRDGMFTFVVEDVGATNNFSERMLRFAVIIRKVCFHTMSDKGSETLSILLSVFKTMELRGLDPYTETLKLIEKYILDQKSKKMSLAA